EETEREDVGNEAPEEEEPAAAAKPAPRAAAPPPRMTPGRRRGEPAPTEAVRANANSPVALRGAMLWIIGAAVVALVPALVGLVVVLRSSPSSPSSVAGLTTHSDVPPPNDDTGRGQDGGGKPADTSKGAPPARVDWPPLSAGAAPPAKDKL